MHVQEAAVRDHPRLLDVDEHGLHGSGHALGNAVSATRRSSTPSIDNGFLVSNFVLGLDALRPRPEPAAPGTTIPNDSSGIVDGQKLDVPFVRRRRAGQEYFECDQGDAIDAALDALPAAVNGDLTGIGTWTRGALDVRQKLLRHDAGRPPGGQRPESPRLRSILLVTDGEWTNPQGNMKLDPAAENPAPAAGDLFNNDEHPDLRRRHRRGRWARRSPTSSRDAGGTGRPIDAANPQALVDALQEVIQDLINSRSSRSARPASRASWSSSTPRRRCSTSTAGAVTRQMGQGGWEQAREALAGDRLDLRRDRQQRRARRGPRPPRPRGVRRQHADRGGASSSSTARAARTTSRGPSTRQTSCVAPGCIDPYAVPPITWTFQDGSLIDPPGFDETTLSHMPKCNQGSAQQQGCFGSGTYTHLGLITVQNNIAAYKAECNAERAAAVRRRHPVHQHPDHRRSVPTRPTPSTGRRCRQMFTAGITTYVIGFGDGVDVPAAIANLKTWPMRLGQHARLLRRQQPGQLELALERHHRGLTFDPCCKFNDCAFNPEPKHRRARIPSAGDRAPLRTWADDQLTTGDAGTGTGTDTNSGQQSATDDLGPPTDDRTPTTGRADHDDRRADHRTPRLRPRGDSTPARRPPATDTTVVTTVDRRPQTPSDVEDTDTTGPAEPGTGDEGRGCKVEDTKHARPARHAPHLRPGGLPSAARRRA